MRKTSDKSKADMSRRVQELEKQARNFASSADLRKQREALRTQLDALRTEREALDKLIRRAKELVDLEKLAKRLPAESECKKLVTRSARVIEWASGRDMTLEKELESKFGDSEIEMIVSRSPDLGPAAARTFAHCVSQSAAGSPSVVAAGGVSEEARGTGKLVYIGVSAGRSVLRMAQCVAEPFHRLVLFPLSGVGLPEDVHVSVNTVVAKLSESIMRAGGSLQTMALWVDTLVWLGLGADGQGELIRELRRYVDDMAFAFTGIGALDPKSGDILPRIMGDGNVLSKLWTRIPNQADYPDGHPPEFQKIREHHHLVADMLSRPINRNGEVVRDEWVDMAVFGALPGRPSGHKASGLPTLGEPRGRKKNPAKVVAIAGGERKAEAINAVCRGHLIDVLVTDVSAARRIINLPEQ